MIAFSKVLPKPLAEIAHGSESVWNNTFEISLQDKVLLNASSGKGKTTFISLLYGLRNDYQGIIQIDGRDIKTFSINDWVKLRQQKFSIVFQDLQLFGRQTVRENLELKLNLGSSINFSQIEKWLEELGIPDKLNQPCEQLSFGQQQRVAIVRALIPDFGFLILDEPFSHLDEENASIAMRLINSRCDQCEAGFLLTTLGSNHGLSNFSMLYL